MRTHGHACRGRRTKTYRSWESIIERCLHHTNSQYKYYGGRGIKICTRWLNFENFLMDMGEVPNGLTIDRINTNGHYEASNCRWITKSQQMANRRGWGSTSKFKGVTARGKKFRARIRSNGVLNNLGTFENEISAALAYDAAAINFFGEFASLNNPEG